MKSVLGIVGGSGLYDLPGLTHAVWTRVTSPWGEPSDDILFAEIDGLPVRFLPRHGRGHRVSPTDINYRANIDQHEVARRQVFTQRPAGGDGDHIGDAGSFHRVDVGAVVDVGRRNAMAAAVAGQEPHRQTIDLSKQNVVGRFAPGRGHSRPDRVCKPR